MLATEAVNEAAGRSKFTLSSLEEELNSIRRYNRIDSPDDLILIAGILQ